MARINLVIKYIFIVSTVIVAGLAVGHLTVIKHWWTSDSRTQDDLIYNASSLLTHQDFDAVLKKHYLRCLTNPSKPFCLLSANKRLELFQNDRAGVPDAEVIESRLKNINSDFYPGRIRIHSVLAMFTRLMKIYDVQVLLIEPSVLFCLLSSEKKYDMLSMGFNPSRLQGSRNVVTVGVFSENSKNLEEPSLTREVLSSGFKIVKFRKWIRRESEKSFETVHYFFILQDIAIHVVIFYPQNTYLWHAGLDKKGVDLEGLLFEEDGIFENVRLLPLDLNGTSISRMFLPHDVLYFMKEMEASRFVHCTAISSSIVAPPNHPTLTAEQLTTRALIAIKELKTLLVSQTLIFWLWSKTLLGWFLKCDIFHYSTTLELALMHTNTQGQEVPELLADNEFLEVANNTELARGFEHKLNCHGLDIKVFILHEDKNLLLSKRSDGLRNLKLTYPKFTLCSTQVFGQKIHVPCNAREILKLEFEKSWTGMDSYFSDFTNKLNFLLSSETEI